MYQYEKALWDRYDQFYNVLKGSILPMKKYRWGTGGITDLTRMIDPITSNLFVVRVLHHYGWIEFLKPTGGSVTFRFTAIPNQYIEPPSSDMASSPFIAYVRGEFGRG